jgi:YHS domain-containing protein
MVRLIVAFLAVLMMPFFTTAQTAAQRQKQYNLRKGLAIEGYDPVSYFKGKPKEGSKQYAYNWNGVTYYFADAQNMNAFKQNPAAYEPQYGGWCAYAMGKKGEKVEVDPETYKILNGKLYLFYNKFFNNTLDSWNKDEAALKAKADQNWARFK